MPGCMVQLSNFVQFGSCFLTNSAPGLAGAVCSNGGVTLSGLDKFNLGLAYTKACLVVGCNLSLNLFNLAGVY